MHWHRGFGNRGFGSFPGVIPQVLTVDPYTLRQDNGCSCNDSGLKGQIKQNPYVFVALAVLAGYFLAKKR